MNEIFGNGDPTTSSRVHLVLLGVRDDATNWSEES